MIDRLETAAISHIHARIRRGRYSIVSRHTLLHVEGSYESQFPVCNVEEPHATILTSDGQYCVGVIGGHAPDSASMRINRALTEGRFTEASVKRNSSQTRCSKEGRSSLTFGFSALRSHSVTTAFNPAENSLGGVFTSFLIAACFSFSESQKSSSSVRVV